VPASAPLDYSDGSAPLAGVQPLATLWSLGRAFAVCERLHTGERAQRDLLSQKTPSFGGRPGDRGGPRRALLRRM